MSINIPKPTRYVNAFYKPVEGGFDKKEDEKQETSRERAARHKRERREELTYDASDEARWARNRERVISERKKIEVPSFDLDDALKNPELDGVKSLNIDPVSMAVETVIDLIDGAKAFIANPSLGGVAAMATIAIPGKVADKFSVGAYDKIKGTVPNMDAHHVGQKALMNKFIPNYDLNKAPAILVPKVGHTLKGPNGIVSRKTTGIDTARGLIARDIKELRRVYPDIPNSQLKKLVDMNKELYPDAFVKRK